MSWILPESLINSNVQLNITPSGNAYNKCAKLELMLNMNYFLCPPKVNAARYERRALIYWTILGSDLTDFGQHQWEHQVIKKSSIEVVGEQILGWI